MVEVEEVEEVAEVVPEGHHLDHRNHCRLLPSSRKTHQMDYA